MQRYLKLKFTWAELQYAVLLLLILQGNLFLKVMVLSLLLIFNTNKILLVESRLTVFFYLYILTVILLGFFTLGWLNDFRYFFSLLFSLIIWGFALFMFNYNDYHVRKTNLKSIRRSLDIVFWVNVSVSLLQLVLLMAKERALNPFSGAFKASTGDFIYGIFSNSSVNMIMSAFFFFYYYSLKQITKSIFAGIVGLMTTYMGGIALAVVSFIVILILNPAIKLKYKLIGLILLLLAYIAFNILSPENMRYFRANIQIALSKQPPRKLIAFSETYDYNTSSIPRFLFGAGPGNFSSRTAFVMGGEYVSWLPQSMTYRSPEFEANHFQLWNKKILSIPFTEGTANQPFSLYNQLPGEYGLVGLLLFFIVYLGQYFKNYFRLSFGKYLLVFLLLIAVMDYWFEYLSVMILFEILMLVQLKIIKESESNGGSKSL